MFPLPRQERTGQRAFLSRGDIVVDGQRPDWRFFDIRHVYFLLRAPMIAGKRGFSRGVDRDYYAWFCATNLLPYDISSSPERAGRHRNFISLR